MDPKAWWLYSLKEEEGAIYMHNPAVRGGNETKDGRDG